MNSPYGYRPVPGWVTEKLLTAAGASERTLKRPFDRLGCPLDAVLMPCHEHERCCFFYDISFSYRTKFNMFWNMRKSRLGYIITTLRLGAESLYGALDQACAGAEICSPPQLDGFRFICILPVHSGWLACPGRVGYAGRGHTSRSTSVISHSTKRTLGVLPRSTQKESRVKRNIFRFPTLSPIILYQLIC